MQFQIVFVCIEWEDMDRIDRAQVRDKWRSLVNAVMNSRVSIKCGEFLACLRDGSLLKKDSALWS